GGEYVDKSAIPSARNGMPTRKRIREYDIICSIYSNTDRRCAGQEIVPCARYRRCEIQFSGHALLAGHRPENCGHHTKASIRVLDAAKTFTTPTPNACRSLSLPPQGWMPMRFGEPAPNHPVGRPTPF